MSCFFLGLDGGDEDFRSPTLFSQGVITFYDKKETENKKTCQIKISLG